MSRLGVYLLAVLISLLLGGRALVWRGADGADAAETPGGGAATGPAAASGERSGSVTEASGPASGSDESSPGRDRTYRVPGGIDPRAPDYRGLTGWPGFAEAELRFGREDEDPRWAKQTEIRLLSMISELDNLALSRLEAECRESMCRLLLVYPPGTEPIYTIRQIYERVDALGLGPALAETRVEGGDVETLRLFLRRLAAVSSPR